MPNSVTRNDMAQAVVQALYDLPHRPAADDPRVLFVERSQPMPKLASYYGQALARLEQCAQQPHEMPACLAGAELHTLPPQLNLPSYTMTLTLSEAAAEVMRESVEWWSRHPIAGPQQREVCRYILELITQEETVMANCRAADVARDQHGSGA